MKKEKGCKMRKIIKCCACGLVMTMLLAGCAKKDNSVTEQPEVTTEAATESEAIRERITMNEDNVKLGADADKITLGKYKSVEVSESMVKVADEEVQQQIDSLLAQNAVTEDVTDRAAKEGDTVNIDYVGKKDEVAFDGGTAQGYDLTLGSGQFIEGFEEGLIGAKVGETRDLNLTFPTEYHSEDLAGAKVVFSVKVNKISVQKEAVLNDEFVKKNARAATTVEAYRDEIKQDITELLKGDAAWALTMNDSQFEITDKSLEDAKNESLEYLNQQFMMYYGMTADQLIAEGQIEEEMFNKDIDQQALNMVKSRMMINAIVEEEGMEISDQDVEDLAAEFEVYADAADMTEQVGEDAINEYILQRKVIDFLTENAVVK